MSLDDEIEVARKKVVTDGYDMSFGEIISMYKAKEFEIQPDFQRLFRWEPDQKSRFIESLLLGIPVPPIFVNTDAKGRWELIDGLQRISTVLQFTGNLVPEALGRARANETPLRLMSTKLLPSLANRTWSAEQDPACHLSLIQQLAIKRTRLRVEILKRESDESAKYELFQRLNTGGSTLTQQEVRDCLVLMISPAAYKRVAALATNSAFVQATNLSETKQREQLPRELVIRWLAYLNFPYQNGRDVHEYLDDCAVAIAKGQFAWSESEKLIKDAIGWLNAATPGGAFCRWDGNQPSGSFSMAAFESITVGVGHNIELYRRLGASVREDVLRRKIVVLWKEATFKKYSGAGVRGTSRIQHLLPFAKKFFQP